MAEDDTMDEHMCSICQMQLTDPDEDGTVLECSSLLCGHTFHHICLSNYARATNTQVACLACPLCKRKASSFTVNDTILLSDVEAEVGAAREAETTDGQDAGSGAAYGSAAGGRVWLPGELSVTIEPVADGSAAAGGLGLPAELASTHASEPAADGNAPAPAVHPAATTVGGTPKAKAAPKAKAPAPKMAARFRRAAAKAAPKAAAKAAAAKAAAFPQAAAKAAAAPKAAAKAAAPKATAAPKAAPKAAAASAAAVAQDAPKASAPGPQLATWCANMLEPMDFCATCGNEVSLNKTRMKSKCKGTWECFVCRTKITQLYRSFGEWPTSNFKKISEEEQLRFFAGLVCLLITPYL